MREYNYQDNIVFKRSWDTFTGIEVECTNYEYDGNEGMAYLGFSVRFGSFDTAISLAANQNSELEIMKKKLTDLKEACEETITFIEDNGIKGTGFSNV